MQRFVFLKTCGIFGGFAIILLEHAWTDIRVYSESAKNPDVFKKTKRCILKENI